MIIKTRRKAFSTNLHRPYKRVKPILWITAGVKGLKNGTDRFEYMKKIFDSTEDMHSEYHVLLTPTTLHSEIEMRVL